MSIMGTFQTGAVYVIVLVFVAIFGQTFYGMLKDQNEIRKAKHEETLKKIKKGGKRINGKRPNKNK